VPAQVSTLPALTANWGAASPAPGAVGVDNVRARFTYGRRAEQPAAFERAAEKAQLSNTVEVSSAPDRSQRGAGGSSARGDRLDLTAHGGGQVLPALRTSTAGSAEVCAQSGYR
jgi:hypothetical protein